MYACLQNIRLHCKERTLPQPAPIVIVTRLGVGVYDEAWWNARLTVFEAITWPSVSRFQHLDVTWNLMVDVDMPVAALDKLKRIVRDSRPGFCVLRFVENHSHLNSAISCALGASAVSSEKIIAYMIDDDDAISADFFENIFKIINQHPEKSQVISLSNGNALDAPDGRIATLHYVASTTNTVFYMEPSKVRLIIFTAHFKWLETAKNMGFLSVENSEFSGQSLYTYHQQGDGSYEQRISALDDWRTLTDEDCTRFGIRKEIFENWRKVQANVPPTIGLTWRRTQSEQLQLSEVYRQARALKRQMIETNSDIFDPESNFLYINYPQSGDTRKTGRIAFHGTCTPGRTVLLKATGRSGKYQTLGNAISNHRGDFGIAANFAPGEWGIRIELLGTDNSSTVKTLAYTLEVTR